jgi:hypothetical protein
MGFKHTAENEKIRLVMAVNDARYYCGSTNRDGENDADNAG